MLDKKTDREGHRDPCRSEDWIYRRGDIYLANLNPFKGSEQGGTRPVLVLQNNDGNYYCPTLIVAPITTKLKKLNMPTHCYFEKVRGLAEPSMVSDGFPGTDQDDRQMPDREVSR